MSALDIISTIFIGPLKLLFELIFSAAYSVMQHPGPATVVLSLAMNILLLPLYQRADDIQLEARDTENKLHDVVAHIKKTFSGDERMMILQTYYRQNNYSPLSVLSGSVSLMLEIPFFMAAYQFLTSVNEFQGAAFGPIPDLSLPDGMLILGGTAFNLLPVLMTLVNIVSCALYLKGFPLKTKIQLYGMAFFFLVFLYDSPSALVLYWTLNNVFSLVKTLFLRIRNARKVLNVLLAVLGIAAIGTGISMEGFLRTTFMICLGFACQLPWLLPLLRQKLSGLLKKPAAEKPNTALFVCGALFLATLTGLLIPSTYVSASTQEYIDVASFYNPIWYVVYTFCLAVGTFLVWMGVFYWLAKPQTKVLFTRLIWTACGIMIVNYMFFGTNLGIVSSTLEFTQGLHFSIGEKLVNVAVVLILFILLYAISGRSLRKLTSVLLAGTIALGSMSAIHMSQILTSAQNLEGRLDTSSSLPAYSVSQNGKNVIVVFLDCAFGPIIPYLMEENPQLIEQFDGFTYYSNTLSYGPHTAFSTPSLYGGYEYTPVKINLRDSDLMSVKHNEALKVLPTIFSEEGYNVVVTSPPYAGYQWTPDLSIYDDIENARAYMEISAMFSSSQLVKSRQHNFFLFSIMKTLPVVLQPYIYTDGTYRALSPSGIVGGTSSEFVNASMVLQDLSRATEITPGTENNFMYLCSNITHAPVVLQEPTYEYSETVDNSAYYPEEGKTITAGNTSRLLDSDYMIANYHVNMAGLMLLGDWFDYLRENGVYDNSKIILVSDHGNGAGLFDDSSNSIDRFLPLLMVKDFNAQGFSVSDDFMTNADVPTLAVSHLGQTVLNPFTGNPITSKAKYEEPLQVIVGREWDIDPDRGYQFLPAQWATVSGNVTVKENWVFHEGETLLPPNLNS